MPHNLGRVIPNIVLFVDGLRIRDPFLVAPNHDSSCIFRPRRSQIDYFSPHDTFCSSSAWRMSAGNVSPQKSGLKCLQQTIDLIADKGNNKEVDCKKEATGPTPRLRKCLARDGTSIVMRSPSPQDLLALGMGSWFGQKEFILALVALQQGEANDGELATLGSPRACAVVEGHGGSSVATRVCILRHRRLVGVSEEVEHALLHETITQFLNTGSRISQLRVEVDEHSMGEMEAFYARHGFVGSASNDERFAPGRLWLSGDRRAALKGVRGLLGEKYLRENGGNAILANLLGRLLHDTGDLQGAVDAYLKALEVDPSRSEVLLGLGGAYHGQGQFQMAFASYQQAIKLAPADALAYLKLGLLYEHLAMNNYEEAGENAIRCLEYYLQQSGSNDTAILTKLGNLQVRQLCPAEAVGTYERALAVDPSLSNVWFNLANAYLKLRKEEHASRCLKEKVGLDDDPGVSTKYLLASLESDLDSITEEDQVAYSRELFDYYATSYDDHMRMKLLYTAPRVLLQALPEATRSMHGGDVLTYLNGSLDILDLGCGTGLVGIWFKDCANELVGVDVSRTMLDMALKKGCYHDLQQSDARTYLATSDHCRFDLITAAETLQYLGSLERTFMDAFRVLKPGSLFAFTLPQWEILQDGDEDENEDGKCDQDYDANGRKRFGKVTETTVSGQEYCLTKEGTYAYTRRYLQTLARQCGYETVTLRRYSAKVERGEPVPGHLGVLRRPVRSKTGPP